MCSPIDVRPSSSTSAQADSGSHDRDDRDLPDLDVANADGPVELGERGGGLAQRPEPEERDRLQEERDGEGRDEHHRARLRPQGAEDSPLHREREQEHDGDAERDPDPDRPVAIRGVGERERPGHDQLPIREVDEAKDAEHEPDADGHQRVDRAQADRVDLNLEVDRVAQEVGEAAGEELRHER